MRLVYSQSAGWVFLANQQQRRRLNQFETDVLVVPEVTYSIISSAPKRQLGHVRAQSI